MSHLEPAVTGTEILRGKYFVNIGLECRDIWNLFLDAAKECLASHGINDINESQAFLMYLLNDQKLTAGDLIEQGLYDGSNVSYNLKKLKEHGYITTQPSDRPNGDKRNVFVSLTDKGRAIVSNLEDHFSQKAEKISIIAPIPVRDLVKALATIRQFASLMKSPLLRV